MHFWRLLRDYKAPKKTWKLKGQFFESWRQVKFSQVKVMSKNIVQLNNPENVSELVGGDDISFLEGKLKTFIESLGFPEKQEKATKDIIQEIIWDWFYYIRDHYTDYLLDKRRWYFQNRPENPKK